MTELSVPRRRPAAVHGSTRRTGLRAAALVAAGCLAVAGCRSVLSAIFDVPPRRPAPARVPSPQATAVFSPAVAAAADTVRPPIERTLNPDSAAAMLPRDQAGNIDWMAALRSGVIRPRSVPPGQPAPIDPPPFQFAFDFLFPGPDTTTDAFFPHSSHTEWLACQQCHPRVVKYRGTVFNMSDVLQGRICGLCHGKVAFSVTGPVEGCERCHRSFAPRSDRPQLLAAVAPSGTSPSGTGPDHGASEKTGKEVYERWCLRCHGANGEGDGPLGKNLYPRPRDFTAGAYQIRTTGSGESPTDADLERVVAEGIPGTAMPGWKNKLTAEEREAVIGYIKKFDPFMGGAPAEPLAVSPQPPPSSAGLTEGRRLFQAMKCWECHGQEGRGDGPSAPTLKDDLGFPIRPADLTKGWTLNGGGRVEDIYTRMRTGLNGTPMPSYANVTFPGLGKVSDEQLWRIAQYVNFLSAQRSPLGDLYIRLRRVTSDSTVAASDTIGFSGGMRTDSLPRARFPHWLHRIRYRCKVCHVSIFEPQAQANAVTMKMIGAGEACGRCHNGQTAFRAGFGECERCHVPELRPARGS